MATNFNILSKKPNITLIANFAPFVFVVPPTDFSVSHTQDIASYNIMGKGEVKGKGTPNCRVVSFSGHFPNVNSSLYSMLNPLTPLACQEYLTFIKDKDIPCSIIVPEWGEFLKVKIQDLTFTRSDHTGDIDYTITLVENRQTFSNLVDMVTGLFTRG